MSHYIEIDGVREKIFILQNISLSGENFSTRYGVGVESIKGEYSNSKYWRLIKSIVSNSTLEIAVKLRNSAELLSENNLSFSNEKSIVCYSAGKLADGLKQDNDFIFLCNKIIHAKKFRVDSVGSTQYHKDLNWWDGLVTISGTLQGKRKKPWEFFFSITEWCDAALKYIDSIEENLLSIQANSEDQLHRS